MEPLPDLADLGAQVQKNHVEHVRIEIELARTFLEMAKVEYSLPDVEAGDISLTHARQAIDGARRGLSNVMSGRDRFKLAEGITETDLALQNFDAFKASN